MAKSYTNKSDTSCAVAVIVFILTLAICFGITYLVTLLTVAVLAAFGVTAPFWAVFGCWVLLGFVAQMFRSK